MSLLSCYIFLISFVVLLSSCGGGGGTSATNQTSVASSSSSTVSSIPTQSVLANESQIYTLDEDSTLTDKINFNYDSVMANGEDLTSTIYTSNGGVLQLFSNDMSLSNVFFTYKPAEDFNGDDDCDVYLTRNNSDGIITRQKIKINFHVNAVVDENVKFDITNKKVFVAGETVQLSFPYQPDTHTPVPADLDFKLSIDDIPVGYSVNAGGLSFVMPLHHVAGAKKLNIEFEYQDKTINSSRPLLSKIDYGDIEYWMGDKGRPGATYVVITEQRVDRQQYLDWVNAQFTNFLNTPLVAQYSGYWNLVVIKKPAPENYAFIGNADVSPILFADLKESGNAYIKNFVPNYDGVILNTSLEGRATGSLVTIVNFPHINILLHEFGHLHAKLGDEYADTSYPRYPIYMEGLNPNITNFNDYESIPWKHWIVDKTNIPNANNKSDPMIVGAFLGANYKDDQFYRPMFSSIMGVDLFAPMGPVYSEAWALGTYERLGILGSVTDTKNANLRSINVAKAWNKNLTRLDWFLNDIKQDAWTNQSTITIDENTIATNNYSIKAELTDLTGYVKDAQAYSGFKWFNHPEISYENLGRIDSLDSLKNVANENFLKTWTFEKSSTASAVKSQKQNAQADMKVPVNNSDWVSHSVAIKNGAHQLVSSSRYNIQDTLAPVTLHSEFRADIFDASGKQLYSVGVDNPYPHYHGEKGLIILKESGSYNIKHPYIKGSYQIAVVDVHTGQGVSTLNVSSQK